jgi:hypothetical protein
LTKLEIKIDGISSPLRMSGTKFDFSGSKKRSSSNLKSKIKKDINLHNSIYHNKLDYSTLIPSNNKENCNMSALNARSNKC